MSVTRSNKVSDALLLTLLADFERSTTVSTGGLQFNELGFDETFEILPDAFRFRPSVGRRTAIGLLRHALIDCRNAGPLTIEALVSQANALDHAARAVPNERYTIWTKFRATNMAHHPGFRLEWQGVRIRSAANLPTRISQEEYFLNGVGRIYPNRPQGYGHVIMSVDARDERSAMDQALEALQLVMGLANMFETQGRWSHGGHRYWTEGKWWLGPHQFVFRGDQFLGNKRIWYNGDYDETAWMTHAPQMGEALRVMPLVRRALRELANHPLRSLLIQSILLLQDGFASRDGSHRLLRYWSALERLYVEEGARGASNQKVIDRASFAELNPAISRWKLNHAAQLRNNHAHVGGTDDDLQVIGQFLRHLFARHLNHWIFQGSSFANQTQLLAYLDLPSDKGALTQLSYAIDRRLSLIEEHQRSLEIE
jgi:hypothetical protein